MKTLLFALILALPLAARAAHELVATDVMTTESMTKPTLSGGGSVIVGGDAMDERIITAWFYGNEPIKTCYNHIETFGATEAVATSALREAILTWQNYFKEKQISLGKEPHGINLNFQMRGKCKGDEDLVIHFGTGPIFGNMGDLKTAETLHNPVAYVNKTHLSKDALWSKGYIRFVPRSYYPFDNFPDWNIKDALKSMLIHELGHVLGFVHEPNTIMDGAIVQKVFLTKEKSVAPTVDQKQDLITCSECDSGFQMLKTSTTPQAAQKFLQRLGFTLSAPIALLKSKGALTLVQGEKRHAVERLRETVTENRTVLHVMFPDAARREKQTILWQGTIQGTAVLAVYNANPAGAQGLLQLHVLNTTDDVAVLDFVRGNP